MDDESPFEHPKVSRGYPLDKEEKASLMPIDKQEQQSGGSSAAKAMWGVVIILGGSVLLALVLGIWSHWLWKFFEWGWNYVD